MSILSRNLIPNPTCRANLFTSSAHTIPIFQSPNFYRISKSNHLPYSWHLQTLICKRCRDISSLRSHRWQIKVSDSNGLVEGSEELVIFNFDSFLSLSELIFLVSSFVVSVGCLVNWAFLKQNNLVLVALGNRVLLWLLAGSVVLGTVIRRRQWRRVSGVPVNSSGRAPQYGNVIERVEKLEESLGSATTIIRVLSRQLEKLGIRFRVTRKTLKDPIAETAALAQKNSEATRALAAQHERLEKELGEVQKVLLAMQDQQQKQIELILAIAKNGKPFENKRESSQGEGTEGLHGSQGKASKETGSRQEQASAGQKSKNNDSVVVSDTMLEKTAADSHIP